MKMTNKPECKLIGQNGNIFSLLGQVTKTLRKNGLTDEAKEVIARVSKVGSYSEALNLIGEYVEII